MQEHPLASVTLKASQSLAKGSNLRKTQFEILGAGLGSRGQEPDRRE